MRRTRAEIESDVKLGSKVCLKCGERKDFYKFNMKSQFPDGRASLCRACESRKSINRRTADELREELIHNKKTCCVCNETKSRDDFWNTKITRDGKTYECKVCGASRKREYGVVWNDKLYTIKRLSLIRNFYNSSEEEISNLMNAQKGCCAICGDSLVSPDSKKHYAIDHNHNTNRVRGLLCLHCNSMLGQARESLFILQKGIDYLNERGHYGE